jgi:hypothetical protein
MANYSRLTDSGKRQEFITGSRRDTRDGKGRYDLVSPFSLNRLARVLELGASKYGDRNWEKGQPLSRYIDSAIRHIMRRMEGRTDEDHAGCAMWNLHAFIHTEEMIERGLLPKELNDLPTWTLSNTMGIGPSGDASTQPDTSESVD